MEAAFSSAEASLQQVVLAAFYTYLWLFVLVPPDSPAHVEQLEPDQRRGEKCTSTGAKIQNTRLFKNRLAMRH